MNCQDLSRVLDERDTRRLPASERAQIEHHLGSCSECARDWSIHERMLAVRIPAMSERLGLWRPPAALGVASNAWARPILITGLLLGTAAAATLAGLLLLEDPTEPGAATQSVVSTSTGTESARVAADSTEPETAAAAEPVAESAVPAPSPPRPFQFTLGLVRPESVEDLSPSFLSTYAALPDVLRAIPNLILVEVDLDDLSFDSSGRLAVAPPSGIDIVLQPLDDERNDLDDVSVRWSTQDHSGFWGFVGSGSGPRERASVIVDRLTQSVFPPSDLSVLSDIRRRALDVSLGEEQRIEALEELDRLGVRFAMLDEDTRRDIDRRVAEAAVEIANGSTDPEVRYRAWAALRGAGDPSLVAPLVDSLLTERVDYVRLEIAKLLASDYGDNPTARAALVYAGNSDSMPELQTHARWAALDDDGRRSYLARTLMNRNLPDGDRLALVIADVPGLGEYLDAGAASALAQIAGRSPDAARKQVIVYELGRAASPDVLPTLLDTLANDPSEDVRAVAAEALMQRADEPEVRAALQRAGTNDASPSVRRAARLQ